MALVSLEQPEVPLPEVPIGQVQLKLPCGQQDRSN
jgi:hypothetical protein